MKPLVLVNLRSQHGNQITGIGRYTLTLLDALIDRGSFDYALVSTWSKDQLPQRLGDRLRHVLTVDNVRPHLWSVIRQALEYPNIADKLGASVILNADPIGFVRGGKARVFIAHDLYFLSIPELIGTSERMQAKLIWPLMLRFNDRVACVSETTQSDIRRFYPAYAGKTVVIGSDSAQRVATVERHPAMDTLNGPYLLYVGNLLPNKNIATLTEALDILAARGVRLQAVHVGRDDRGLLEQAASRMRVAAPPLRLGAVSDSQLNGLYANALCLVNTSLYEGFCIPVVEAQRAGTPVVCSTMPAVGETAGAGALLFDPREPAQLADHLQTLLTDPQMRGRLQALGHENAARFSWDKTAERLERLFAELLAA